MSERKIAAELDQLGVPAVGECWHGGAVRHVLAKERAA